MPTVLTILADGFEEIEAFTPVDLLRRAGIEVTVATLSENRHATGRSGITAHGDVALSAVRATLFDLIFLPGDPACSTCAPTQEFAKSSFIIIGKTGGWLPSARHPRS